MAFAKRQIELTFRLGRGAFGDSGYDTLTVSGLRVRAEITEWGGDSMGEAQLRIYGLTPSVMNKLSALTADDMIARNNSIAIAAGDETSGVSKIFDGQITLGQIDLNGAPDAALNVIALAGALQAVQSADPASYSAAVDAADVMKGLATRMGLAFENSGVSVMLSPSYFRGTLREQARRCAEAANINWTISKGTLAIWPKIGCRSGDPPLIAPETGMIGYPGFSTSLIGITVGTIFNPALNLGQRVQVKSSLKVATGYWTITGLSHDIESETPGGAWMTRFQGVPAQ